MHSFLASLPRKYKILIMVIGDVILLPLALWSAIALRYSTFSPDVAGYWWLFFLIPVFAVPIFIRLGLYRAVIRFLDEKIIRTVVFGVTLSVLILLAIVVMAQIQGLPRSSIMIYWIISVGYITSSRYLARGILRQLEFKDGHKKKVAIYGAGRAGMQTALALMSGPEYKPVIFFDDKRDLHGASIVGIRVYNPENAIEIMNDNSCYQLLLALPSATRSQKAKIIEKFERQNIQLKTIPGMSELVNGDIKIEDIREVGVEDLLGRDTVPPFQDLFSICIAGKSVLVTGAGGSIGSELCRQIMINKPNKLILFEQSEFALYKLEQELLRHHPQTELFSILGDVRVQNELEVVIKKHSVDTVYHAAAYKHVPIVESNIVAGVMNNVFGTLAVAKAALNQNVKNLVLISTDKAVRPTNVMGATKRIAELILQAMAGQNPATCMSMVRFGNVLGSSGSVVPLFKEQIKAGGTVTVTHPDVTRYFMTVNEAAELVIQAGAMSSGGDVFVLDMGKSVKISDLAKKMIELSGFRVKESVMDEEEGIAIEYVGLRPGEKLYEELLIGSNVAETRHPRIMKAHENFLNMDELSIHLRKLHENCQSGATDKILENLKDLVSGYGQPPA